MDNDQLIAASHNKGPAIVIAGPGCGKTSIISNRIKILKDKYNVNPNNIAAISFTRYSSMQLKNRTLEMDPSLTDVFYGTFHSYFLKILTFAGAYTYKDVLGQSEIRSCISAILRNELKSGYIAPEIIQEMISNISTFNALNHQDVHADMIFENQSANKLFYTVYDKYTQYKSDNKKIDFDDILLKTYDVLLRSPLMLDKIKNKKKYYIIDEYQDINKIQFDIIKLLLDQNENIFVVGDDDQSIYSFRGSNPQFLTKFKTYFENAAIYKAISSYRCPSDVLQLTNSLIRNNKERVEKQIRHISDLNGSIKIAGYERSEIQAMEISNIIKNSEESCSDFMIIYRTNLQAVPFIARFTDMNIPYVIKDSAADFFENFILKDILAYFRLSQNFSIEDMNRIRNKPNRFMKKIELSGINDYIISEESKIKLSIKSISIGERLSAQSDRSLYKFVRDSEYISDLTPGKAIDYIRTKIGYDKYLKSYSEKSGISMEYFEEIFEHIYTVLSEIKNLSSAIDYIDSLKKSHKESDTNNQLSKSVLLTTVHGAKGLERKNVFVISVNEGIMPHKKSLENIEEERRIMYVACTRAKENLQLSYVKTFKNKKLKKSIFLQEMDFK